MEELKTIWPNALGDELVKELLDIESTFPVPQEIFGLQSGNSAEAANDQFTSALCSGPTIQDIESAPSVTLEKILSKVLPQARFDISSTNSSAVLLIKCLYFCFT